MSGRIASVDWSDAPLCRSERVTDNLNDPQADALINALAPEDEI